MLKKLIGIPVLLAVAGSALAVGVVASHGDVNGDGKTDKLDARLIIRLMVRPGSMTAAQKAAADVNGDGVVDMRDARAILTASKS